MVAGMTDTVASPATGLFRRPDFRRYFAAATASKAGTQVAYLAVPLVAALTLNASPGQVGLLATLSTVAFLLIGLPAGAWVDRLRRRRVMIAADVVRALLLASIPLAWWADRLSLHQLYAVVLLNGAATVFFDVANQSYIPQVAGRDRLLAANSALHSMEATTGVAGPSLAGYLVQLLSAPAALAAAALSYLASGALLLRLRRPETPAGTGRPLLAAVAEGLRFVVRHPVLRPVAIAGAMTNLSIQITTTMLPVLFTRELGLPAGALGLFYAAGGVGVLIGALAARPLGQRLGQGRTLWLVGLLIAPAGLLVPLLDRGGWLWAATGGWVLVTIKIGVDNVILVSFRQRVTPDHLLGRQNATMRFLLTGALAVGAALSGLIGQFAGVRAALWAGAVVLALVWVPLFLSPLRRLRDLP